VAPSTIFSTSAPCRSLASFVGALQLLAAGASGQRRRGGGGGGTDSDGGGAPYPAVEALEQLIRQRVQPKLEQEIEPRFWAELRRCREATTMDPELRLLMGVNKPGLDQLFMDQQLSGGSGGFSGKAQRSIGEVRRRCAARHTLCTRGTRHNPRLAGATQAQFHTLLARLGIQGPWLSKKEIEAVTWLVKSSWDAAGSHSSSCGTVSSAAPSLELSLSPRDFQRALLLVAALNFPASQSGGGSGGGAEAEAEAAEGEREEGGASSPAATIRGLGRGFAALLGHLQSSVLGQQLGFRAVAPKPSDLAKAQAQAQNRASDASAPAGAGPDGGDAESETEPVPGGGKDGAAAAVQPTLQNRHHPSATPPLAGKTMARRPAAATAAAAASPSNDGSSAASGGSAVAAVGRSAIPCRRGGATKPLAEAGSAGAAGSPAVAEKPPPLAHPLWERERASLQAEKSELEELLAQVRPGAVSLRS
jgi:hypothetical protein